jgi:sensor histidine kinase YesM
MKMKTRFVKELPRAIVIGLSIFFIIVLIQFYNGYQVRFGHELQFTFLYTMLYTFALHFANTAVFLYMDKIFTTNRFSKKRIIVGFVASLIVSVFTIFLVNVFTSIAIEGETIDNFIKNERLANYITAIIFTIIVLFIINLIYLYKWYQDNKFKEQKIIAGTASAKYESLKNQIDPHFLFNSLNVLSSLIEENPENAQRFTTSLSKVYRYVLEQKDKDLISVVEELSFAKTYMNLLKMRFENSLTYEIPTETTDLDAKVVPLSLQLLLENTVKHNIVSESKPLHIKIYIENDMLCIENNLQKKEVFGDRKGVGLQNIVDRYDIISKRKIKILETEKQFIVKIPILKKDIIIMETQNIYSEKQTYEKARARVDEIKGFYGNLLSYCIVISILAIINFNTSPKYLWFFWPMFGWGFGVAMHALGVFGIGQNWEDKKIKEIMSKNDTKNQWN